VLDHRLHDRVQFNDSSLSVQHRGCDQID
jgi:hypothetical protein